MMWFTNTLHVYRDCALYKQLTDVVVRNIRVDFGQFIDTNINNPLIFALGAAKFKVGRNIFLILINS